MKSLFFSKFLLPIALIAFFILPFLASAQIQIVQCGPGYGKECELCDIFEMLGKIIDLARIVATVLGTAILIWASLVMITSAGNPSKAEQAKKILFGTIAGLILIYIGWGIVVMIYKAVGAGDPTDWTSICS